MDKYQRVVKPKADTPIDANEIRITSQGRARNYITYAMTLLQVFDEFEMCLFTFHGFSFGGVRYGLGFIESKKF